MVFTCHSRWVTKIEDIMMKMVPRPLPSLISSVILWFSYTISSVILVAIALAQIRTTYLYFTLNWWHIQEIDNEIQPSSFCHCRRDSSSGRSKLQLKMIHFTTAYILPSFFFYRTLNFNWLFVQYLLPQEPFTYIKVDPNTL